MAYCGILSEIKLHLGQSIWYGPKEQFSDLSE